MTEGGPPADWPATIEWMSVAEFFDALRLHQGEMVELQQRAGPPRKALLIVVAFDSATVQYRDTDPPPAPVRIPVKEFKVVYTEDSAFGQP